MSTRPALALLLFAACVHAPALPPRELQRALSLQAVGPVEFNPSQLDGKVVVIGFFATWCFPCLQDMPNLEALQKRFGPQGLAVVAVGMDLEGPLVLDPFAYHYRFTFPVVVASRSIREGESAFGAISVLPTTVVLAKDGKVLAAYSGVAAPERVAHLVERALGD